MIDTHLMATLLVASTLTGLITEGIKATLDEMGVAHKNNLLAGAVSVAVALCMVVCEVLGGAIHPDGNAVVYAITLAVLAWLSAMLGYDKVCQTVTQIGKGGGV